MTPMLSCHDISYSVRSRQVLSGVSLEARSGLPVAVMGPSGAGKSTLLAVLAGLLEPATGEVCLDDMRVDAAHADAARARIAIVLQSYGLVDVLTAWENVAITLQAKGFPRREVAERTAAMLATFGLAEIAHHAADELSGGQKQRVAVARALVGRPDVVLADEPTAELDAENRALVLDQLVAAADQGAIVVIASHDPEVAARCAQQVTLVDGRIT